MGDRRVESMKPESIKLDHIDPRGYHRSSATTLRWEATGKVTAEESHNVMCISEIILNDV